MIRLYLKVLLLSGQFHLKINGLFLKKIGRQEGIIKKKKSVFVLLLLYRLFLLKIGSERKKNKNIIKLSYFSKLKKDLKKPINSIFGIQ